MVQQSAELISGTVPFQSVSNKPVTEVEISPGDTSHGSSELNEIPIEQFMVGRNIRQKHLDSDLEQLKSSIAIAGILSPLTVRKTPEGHYEIINGFGRYQAALELGLRTVPCLVVRGTWDEEHRLLWQFHENVFRADLDPISIAMAMKAAKQDLQLTQKELAHLFCRTQSQISDYLSLLKLPQPQQEALRSGAMGLKRGLELLRSKGSTKDKGAQTKSTPVRVHGRRLDLSKSLVIPMDQSVVIVAREDGQSVMTPELALKVLKKIVAALKRKQALNAEEDGELADAMNELARDLSGS